MVVRGEHPHKKVSVWVEPCALDNAALPEVPAVSFERSIALLAAVAAAAVCSGGGALASRAPTRTELAAIQRAVKIYNLSCSGCTWRATKVRVSTVDRHFAVAAERGSRNGQPLQGAQVLLWRGISKWAVIDEGSDVGIGCGFVNARVRKDLFKTAYCP
jgi:hypothetical protein